MTPFYPLSNWDVTREGRLLHVIHINQCNSEILLVTSHKQVVVNFFYYSKLYYRINIKNFVYYWREAYFNPYMIFVSLYTSDLPLSGYLSDNSIYTSSFKFLYRNALLTFNGWRCHPLTVVKERINLTVAILATYENISWLSKPSFCVKLFGPLT